MFYTATYICFLLLILMTTVDTDSEILQTTRCTGRPLGRQCRIITTKSVLGDLSSGIKLPTYLHPVHTDKCVKLNLYLLHTLMMLGLSYYPTFILNRNKLSVVSHCRYFNVRTKTFRNVPNVLWLIPI